MWPAGLIVQYCSILSGYCMTGKGQIILETGKTLLLNKPALASTHCRKWTGPLLKHLVPVFSIQVTHPQRFEGLELPGAAALFPLLRPNGW